MADTSVTIAGLEPLIKRLEAAKQPKVITAALKMGGAHVKSIMAKYPPASSANDPNGRRWYKRGTGSFWRVKDGTIHSKASSQTLGRKWTVKMNGQYTVEIGNNVSYAPFVHDPEKQTWFHKARGWKTTAQVGQSEGQKVADAVRDALMKALQG